MSTSSSTAMAHPDAFYIDGGWTAPSSSAVFEVVQPSTEEVVLVVAAALEEDIDRAITSARTAFDHGPWPSMTHAQRADYLRAMGEGIRKRSNDLSWLWSSEMGILNRIAKQITPSIADVFDYYAGFAESFEFVERHQPAQGNAGYLIREPVGVVGAIIPWNAPLSLMAYKAAPALIAGCTVVLKASPEAPGEALVLAEIADDVGLPPGVLNVVTADREASEVLVRDSRVDKITFTGSTAAGQRIGEILGGRIARYTLELGGKSAAVVLDDYDIGTVAASFAATTPLLSGQVCSSLTRLVISAHRHDELVDALADSFAGIVVGDPFDESSGMGPLAMRRQRDRVEGFIAQAVATGARLVTGGRRPGHLSRGFYIEPTVFGNVDNSSAIARQEVFGPVLCVIAAADEDEAVAIANDSPYGLNASVYTNDAERAMVVARKLRSGTVGHNSQRTDFAIGFGGMKQSGVGREGGREGILPFLEAKTVILDAEVPI